MKKSKRQEEADYWLDEDAPAWWEIALPVIAGLILVGLMIAVLIVSSWVTA